MEISLVVPNRNNLKYFKWMYDSVRKNQGNHTVWICSAIDACTDGTLEHYRELEKTDPHFKYIVNDGPKRLGHTILYDRIVDELVETDLAMIWHCDMYLCPNALDAIAERMYTKEFDSRSLLILASQITPEFLYNPIKKRIVSLTRIEPPLHPSGPEKIVRDFGTEPETFDEQGLLKEIQQFPLYIKNTEKDMPTSGVFAPWAFWVDEFKQIGGHDQLFAPQSKEDSDIWNRFALNGTEFLQTWTGFVYHLTCRGSRRNTLDGAPDIKTNNPEWEAQNLKSSRNFIRKWGHFVRHDEYLQPNVPHKYDIACVITNCNYNLMANLEPWFSELQVDLSPIEVNDYVKTEQSNTTFDLISRLNHLPSNIVDRHDIICYVDGRKFTGDDFYYIQYLSDIITNNDPDDGGEFEVGNLRLKVNRKKTYEHNLIVN